MTQLPALMTVWLTDTLATAPITSLKGGNDAAYAAAASVADGLRRELRVRFRAGGALNRGLSEDMMMEEERAALHIAEE